MGDYPILIGFINGLKDNYDKLTGHPRITQKHKNRFTDGLREITDPILDRWNDLKGREVNRQSNKYISLIGNYLANLDIQGYTRSTDLTPFYQQETQYTGYFPYTTMLLRRWYRTIGENESFRSPTNLEGSLLPVLFQLYGRPIRESYRVLPPVIFDRKRGVIRDLLVPEGEDALSFDLCMLNDRSSIQKPIETIMAGWSGNNNGFIYPNYLNPDA